MSHNQNIFCIFELNHTRWYCELEYVNKIFMMDDISKDDMTCVNLFENKSHQVLLIKKNGFQLALVIDRVIGLSTEILATDQKFEPEKYLDQAVKISDQNKNDREPVCAETEEMFILFKYYNDHFAFPLSEISELVSFSDLQRHVLVSAQSLGFIHRNSLIIPVINLDNKIDLNYNSEFNSLVVAQRDNHYFSFPVHQVAQLVRLKKSEIEQGEFQDDLSNKYKIKSTSHFLKNSEIFQIIKGYQNIYSSDSKIKKKPIFGNENAFLEFKIEEKLHLPLERVEGIDFLNLVNNDQPSTSVVLGYQLFNQEQVPVLDGRSIYEFKKIFENKSSEKVIFIKNKSNLIGVLVDSVDAIIRSDSIFQRAYPRPLISRFSSHFQNDITQFFQTVDYQNGQTIDLKVTSFESLSQYIQIKNDHSKAI